MLPGEKEFAGTLTLHGVTKPVTIKAQRAESWVKSQFEIKLTDYGIAIPEWSGISVAETVKLGISFLPVSSVPTLAR